MIKQKVDESTKCSKHDGLTEKQGSYILIFFKFAVFIGVWNSMRQQRELKAVHFVSSIRNATCVTRYNVTWFEL